MKSTGERRGLLVTERTEILSHISPNFLTIFRDVVKVDKGKQWGKTGGVFIGAKSSLI